MKKHLIRLAIGVAISAAGLYALGKKTGFFEDDRHLYDEFEA
ncbi:methanol dehydrogenase [Enterococcus sp. CSURQ0835]|nr:methanol dehydrogenase [Enterococcus sp. CSURQ0835]